MFEYVLLFRCTTESYSNNTVYGYLLIITDLVPKSIPMFMCQYMKWVLVFFVSLIIMSFIMMEEECKICYE